MADDAALKALKGLISALENYYAPGDSIYEAYSDSKAVQEALDAAYGAIQPPDGR